MSRLRLPLPGLVALGDRVRLVAERVLPALPDRSQEPDAVRVEGRLAAKGGQRATHLGAVVEPEAAHDVRDARRG